jgi:hypothetical protein
VLVNKHVLLTGLAAAPRAVAGDEGQGAASGRQAQAEAEQEVAQAAR